MIGFWTFGSRRLLVFAVFTTLFYLLQLSFCCSLNAEGVALIRFKERILSDPYRALSDWLYQVGSEGPCSWSGVECSSEGFVIVLNLKNLCLVGTLTPDISNLTHIKSLILRNNSFSGEIPEGIQKLKTLELLDIGYNNFSGQFPCDPPDHNLAETILLVDNNELLSCSCPDIHNHQLIHEVQPSKAFSSAVKWSGSCIKQLTSWNSGEIKHFVGRLLLQKTSYENKNAGAPHRFSRKISLLPSRPILSPTPAPTPFSHPDSFLSPAPASSPSTLPSAPTPTLQSLPSAPERQGRSFGDSRMQRSIIITAAIGAALMFLLIFSILLIKRRKDSSVNPWVKGFSGPLHKEVLTGVSRCNVTDLEDACEGFSNVIGSFSSCTLYKGTLHTGVEAAVSSLVPTSSRKLSRYFDVQFRKKIVTLSKVNHTNFINLLGYCEEEVPCARMLVFEYASNGTLFEHLHVKEAERLNWSMRLRIAMGTAYCLDHMHQLQPPLALTQLTSSAIYLTEDNAAKVSDFIFWDKADGGTSMASNVFSFGMLLFEMITGKIACSRYFLEDSGGLQHLKENIDPNLETYDEDQFRKLVDLIKMCVQPQPTRRPPMSEVCMRLREITGIAPDGAMPKSSPPWLELEGL